MSRKKLTDKTKKLRDWRAKNPYRYAYNTTKNNAKRRGKEFTLTFDEFKQFAVEVDYLKKKGITAKSMHIDRVDEKKGYTADNIQPLENSQNVKKYLRYAYENNKMHFSNDLIKPPVYGNEVPF